MPTTISALVAPRQKLSFRRMRRRSTMRSASSDMASIPRYFHSSISLSDPTGQARSDRIAINPPSRLASLLLRFILFVVFATLALAFERRSENVAQGGAGIRRAILGDGLFLLGDFQRFDRDRHAPRAA